MVFFPLKMDLVSLRKENKPIHRPVTSYRWHSADGIYMTAAKLIQTCIFHLFRGSIRYIESKIILLLPLICEQLHPQVYNMSLIPKTRREAMKLSSSEHDALVSS